MIYVGQTQKLITLRKTSVGLYLGDIEETEDVLLPNKYCPRKFKVGDEIEVFVYRDYQERKIATTLKPKITLRHFAFLKVTSVTEVGAFVDWGLEKELLVPFAEQKKRMKEGRWYVVYLDIDERSDRLFASQRLNKYLQNEVLEIQENDPVDLLTFRESDLGYSVIINEKHIGLLYKNEIFKEVHVGQGMKGFVKRIRSDHKIDVSLSPSGFEQTKDSNINIILQALMDNKGFLALTDKSSPEMIYTCLGISKKAFKRTVGNLLKEGKVELQSKGIKLIYS